MCHLLIALSSFSLLSAFPFGGSFEGNQVGTFHVNQAQSGFFDNKDKSGSFEGGQPSFPAITVTGGEQGGEGGQGAFPGGSSFTSEGTSILSDISFFFKLSKEAKEAFGKIVMNTTATKGEIKSAITEWAALYNVSSEVSSLFEKHKSRQSAFRVNITQAMQELPAAVQKMHSIEDDDTLTIRETLEKMRESIDSLTTPYLQTLVKGVLTLGALFQ